MAVTKRTRYEVLRRDGFRCRYCGATPAEAELRVDHVVPVALGGSDAPDNLVAACEPCNTGKAASSPDEALVADAAADALRWAAAMRVARARMVTSVAARTAYVQEFVNEWRIFDEQMTGLDASWESTVRRWHDEQLPIEALKEAVDIAMGARITLRRTFPYLCGVVRNRMAELAADARGEFSDQVSV